MIPSGSKKLLSVVEHLPPQVRWSPYSPDVELPKILSQDQIPLTARDICRVSQGHTEKVVNSLGQGRVSLAKL